MSPIRTSPYARPSSRRASGSSKHSQENDVPSSRKKVISDDDASDSTSEGFFGDHIDLDDVFEFSPKVTAAHFYTALS